MVAAILVLWAVFAPALILFFVLPTAWHLRFGLFGPALVVEMLPLVAFVRMLVGARANRQARGIAVGGLVLAMTFGCLELIAAWGIDHLQLDLIGRC
jgi:hypothetical protein